MNDSNLYQYTECGLDNIFLSNGFERKSTAYGEAVSVVDADGLHVVIAQKLANANSLNGKEFKFLRVETGLSQAALALTFEKTEQTVSLWERGEQPVPKSEQTLLQMLWTRMYGGDSDLGEIVDKINSLERELDDKGLNFHHDSDGWLPDFDGRQCA